MTARTAEETIAKLRDACLTAACICARAIMTKPRYLNNWRHYFRSCCRKQRDTNLVTNCCGQACTMGHSATMAPSISSHDHDHACQNVEMIDSTCTVLFVLQLRTSHCSQLAAPLALGLGRTLVQQRLVGGVHHQHHHLCTLRPVLVGVVLQRQPPVAALHLCRPARLLQAEQLVPVGQGAGARATGP